jgi:molybdate transport system substrate-binding protein
MLMLRGISSMATQALLAELSRVCLQQTGLEMRFESVGGVDAAERVQAGEVFDLVVLAEEATARLAREGHLVPASFGVLAQSSVAIAVPTGATRPDVSSEAALRRTVLSAERIAYSTGPSGTAVLKQLDRWGLMQALAGKLVQSKSGVPVAALLASGQADLGFQQFSELHGQPGVELIGGMPPGMEIVTRFVGAVGARSEQQEAARAALAFMVSPERADIVQGQGMATATP